MTQFVRKIFPKSIDKNLSDYAEETSIHGVKYLTKRSRPMADRIFWIIIFILMSLFLGHFVYKICRTWMKHPVMITNRNKPIQIFEIPFPAITICPQIKVKRDKLNFSNFANEIKPFANRSEFMRSDYGKKITMASQICRKSFRKHIQFLRYTTAFENFTGPRILPSDWIKTLRDISPNFDEIFETCEMSSWNIDELYWKVPSKRNCERLFSPIITNEGICFTFNTIRDILRTDSLQTDFQYHKITRHRDGWDPEIGYTKADAYPYKGIVKGSPVGPGGLKFVLNSNLSNETPFCNPQNVAYKIALHSPSAYPQTYTNENFISLTHGKNYKIAVIPKTIKANANLRSFDPKVRNCYYNDERKLEFYTFYNEENCRLECYTNYSVKIHGGAPFSSPRDFNTGNCILPYKNFGWELPKFLGLFHEHYKVYGKPKEVTEAADFVNCNCLPECNAIHYDSKILKSNDDFSSDVENEVNYLNEDIVQTTIEIIFNEPSFIGQKRVRMYTFETIISDFGGFLGLFLGGSLLSLFELLYFLTIRNCFNIKVDGIAD